MERRVVLAECYVTCGGILLFVIHADSPAPALHSMPLDERELADLHRFVVTNFGDHNAVREMVAYSPNLWFRYDWLIEPLAT